MLTVQFGLAFKMVQEIDVRSLNANLACLLNISLAQFNEIESNILSALNFNAGFSEQSFNANFSGIGKKCKELFEADQAKLVTLQNNVVSLASPNTPETQCSENSKSVDHQAESNICIEDDLMSEETKMTTVKSHC